MSKQKTNAKNKKKCNVIIPVMLCLLLLVSIAFSGFYAYKYYSYPEREVVHCYLKNDSENLDVYYTVQDGKVLRKEEVTTYPYSEELYNELKASYDDSTVGKYLGYMQKLTDYDNKIVKMELIDYERLSDESLKDLFAVTDKDKYLTADEDFYTKGYENLPGFTCGNW